MWKAVIIGFASQLLLFSKWVDARSTTNIIIDKENQKSTKNKGDNNNRIKKKKKKPQNILLLLTDDQDVILGSTDHMPNLQKYLVECGTAYKNGFVHTPVCCPSRASILSGRYLHNHVTRNNSISGGCNSKAWREEIEPHLTFAPFAQQMGGYTTAYAGKYLNRYGDPSVSKNETIPPGWDHWLGLHGNSMYYNYTVFESNDNGATFTDHHHSDDYAKDYLPNVIINKTLHWLENMPEPWLMVLAWPTPHSPFTPAPWAKGLFKGTKAPRTDNYNASEQCMQQKQWLMRQLPEMTQSVAEQVDDYYAMRLEALLSIDQQIELLVNHLNNTGALDDTYILYTSDNGFQFGQHRLAIDKRHLYENDIRVPFILRGPGVPTNYTSEDHIALNIDIAPTIVDIIRRNLPLLIQDDDDDNSNIDRNMDDIKKIAQNLLNKMDGISLLNFVDGGISQRKDFLISYHGEGWEPCELAGCPIPSKGHIWWEPDGQNNTYHCVRTIKQQQQFDDHKLPPSTLEKDENTIYCRFEDDESFIEYYDLNSNPYQLNNDATNMNPIQRQRYEKRLKELLNCHGKSCHPNQKPTTTN